MRPAKRNTSHCFSVFANGYFPCSLRVGSVLCCFGFNLGTQFLRSTVDPGGFVAVGKYRVRGVKYYFSGRHGFGHNSNQEGCIMSISRKVAVKRTLIRLAVAGLVSGLLLAGCGGGASSVAPGGTGVTTGMTLAGALQGYSGGFVPASIADTFDLMVGAPGATNRKGALLIYND